MARESLISAEPRELHEKVTTFLAPGSGFRDPGWEAVTELVRRAEERDRLLAMLEELNATLDVGDDYDSMTFQRVLDWWQQKDGPRTLFDKGFAARQETP